MLSPNNKKLTERFNNSLYVQDLNFQSSPGEDFLITENSINYLTEDSDLLITE